jgi:GGDEF domain-containing protein
MNERRIGELVKEDPSLLPRHAERIAELEFEATRWRQRALTDPVTGLLSERAHIADAPAGQGHAVMALPDVQAVYDNCGQQSGNVFLQDVVAALRPEASKHEARLYRIGTAKLAAITVGVDEAAALMAALKLILDGLSITCALPAGRSADASVAASGLAHFLEQQEGTFGATVRAASR